MKLKEISDIKGIEFREEFVVLDGIFWAHPKDCQGVCAEDLEENRAAAAKEERQFPKVRSIPKNKF